MKLLGIDYGKKKIGLAVGDTQSRFAEPLSVVKYEDEKKAIEKIYEYAQIERVNRLVLGISEGKSAKDTKVFGLKLSRMTGLPVVYADETLTTYDAQNLTLKAGMGRKKRREMEDAFAASLMLQHHLENSG